MEEQHFEKLLEAVDFTNSLLSEVVGKLDDIRGLIDHDILDWLEYGFGERNDE